LGEVADGALAHPSDEQLAQDAAIIEAVDHSTGLTSVSAEPVLWARKLRAGRPSAAASRQEPFGHHPTSEPVQSNNRSKTQGRRTIPRQRQ
jgi:hypothetical protein